MNQIRINDHKNRSYSYWSEELKKNVNIPNELALAILDWRKVDYKNINSLFAVYERNTKIPVSVHKTEQGAFHYCAGLGLTEYTVNTIDIKQ